MRWWKRGEQSLNAEVEDYLARETADNIARGMTPEDARDAARRKLGNATRVKEDTRAAWSPFGLRTWFERLVQDLRHGVRNFRNNPGFAAVAVLSLAVGIGANCAMFSVADAMLLRPLPVKDPGNIVTVGSADTLARGLVEELQISYPDYVDLRDRAQSFESVTAYGLRSVGIAHGPDEVQELTMVSAVSRNFFRDLGIEPALGRSFTEEENRVPGRDAVLVIDHDTWQQQYAGDSGVLGRKVWLGGTEFTIVGVAPERFTGMSNFVHPGYYVPLMMWGNLAGLDPSRVLDNRASRSLTVKARLKPGVSIEAARSEVAAIGAGLAAAYPETNRDRTMQVRTELEARFREDQADSTLAIGLMILAGAVLLVACANVAGLLTSRAPVRAREIATRLAIGASRPRLIRQLLTENLLIALAAGALGVGLGFWGVDLFGRIQIPSDLPIRIVVQLDQRALMVSLAIAAGSVVLFGLIPAIQTTRMDLTSVMKTGASEAGRARLWGRSLLVSAQVAVALVLLTVGTWVYEAFRQSLTGSPGFRKDHLVTMRFDPNMVGYSGEASQRFYRDLLDRARETPGVRSAALATFLPLTVQPDVVNIVPEGYQLPQGQTSLNLFRNRVEGNYFETMGVRILEGRAFRDSDEAGKPLVGIVNEAAARHYWPGESAIGKRLRLNNAEGPWVEIVGVAETSKYMFIAEPPFDFVYLPWRQHPESQMVLLAQSIGSSAELVAPLREAAYALDATQPVFEVRTMEDLFDQRAVRLAGVLTRTVGSMGVMGTVLAIVGLYGLVAYGVSRRTREIGIRMAMGARPGEILRMVVRRGMTLAAAGIVLGFGSSVLLSRVMGAILPTSTAVNAWISVLVALTLVGITLLAAYLPARRAARVDPTVALRNE